MALPRFFDRVADASLPFLDGTLRQDFRERLELSQVSIEAPSGAAGEGGLAGYLLSVNLCARLYPSIRLTGEPEMVRAAAELALAINPACDLSEIAGESSGILSWLRLPPSPGVAVGAAGWDVTIDRDPGLAGDAAGVAQLAVACLGVGELFRTVFADLLGSKGRRAMSPGGFNLVTLGPPGSRMPVPATFDLGRMHMVGAGAIGEAAALAIQHSSASGELVVVEDQTVTLSNLQRYVLTRDESENQHKADVVQAALQGSSVRVTKIPVRWGHDPSAGPGAAWVALVAVDSAQARIDVQASLPQRSYNAFIGELDLGWSRHEQFGTEPCLACLYWPVRPAPHRYELIADALTEHPLRVLSYLLSPGLPVGNALPAVIQGLELPAPPEATQWLERPLIDDIAERFGLVDRARWATASIDDLYHDGVCGGGLVPGGPRPSGDDVSVPLAHQSALAGVMLATQALVASSPELIRLRPPEIEARYTVLASPTQLIPVPRARAGGCLCSDPDFIAYYQSGLRSPQTE